MVQFRILNGKQAGNTWDIDRLPLVVGRQAASRFCLEEAGVWEQHLRLEHDPREGYVVTVLGGALATVNGQPITVTTKPSRGSSSRRKCCSQTPASSKQN